MCDDNCALNHLILVMWAMSDRTLPRSLRTMEGFGIHTVRISAHRCVRAQEHSIQFRLVNAAGKSTFVKFHWKPKQGVQSQVWDEAVKTAGADADYHRRDLYQAIMRGDFPEWELGIQAFDEAFAASLPYDVLDPTKIIPEEVRVLVRACTIADHKRNRCCQCARLVAW
jgi:catalase